MKKEISKTEAIKKINECFKEIQNKNPKEIKKIKRLAMSFKIPLKEKRKLFCKNCLSPYIRPKIRIKNKIKIIECEKCGFVSRWKIKL